MGSCVARRYRGLYGSHHILRSSPNGSPDNTVGSKYPPAEMGRHLAHPSYDTIDHWQPIRHRGSSPPPSGSADREPTVRWSGRVLVGRQGYATTAGRWLKSPSVGA